MFLKNLERNDPDNIDHERIALEEERLSNMRRDNSMHSKTDLDGFLKRMNQSKAQIFTKKAVQQQKVIVNKPHIETQAQRIAAADEINQRRAHSTMLPSMSSI